MKKSSDSRSPLAVALEWSTRVTAISLQMVLPGVLGYWLDLRIGTKMVFLILGVFFGLASGLWSLIRLTREKH
ncbi:MAG: AtpZ/AtpI family protein [Pirellulales bacterium]|nr:AtpZ/AtpI family protein [Pirellulales bacterium]